MEIRKKTHAFYLLFLTFSVKVLSNTLFATSDLDSPTLVRLWNLNTGTQTISYQLSSQTSDYAYISMDIFSTGVLMRSTRSGRNVVLFDQATGTVINTLDIPYSYTQWIYSLATIGTNGKSHRA
jgi:hypothetical protein